MKQMNYARLCGKARWVKRGVICLLALLTVTFILPVATAEAGKAAKVGPTPQYTKQGTEACTRCHSGEIIQVIAESVHGNKENPGTPYAQHGCESCHGPGSFHVSRAHGGVGFPGVLTFGTGKSTPSDKQLKACLNCHTNEMGKLEGMKWQGSIHAGAQMTCSVCHKIHSVENAMADREKQAETCFMCHPQQKTQHRRFENKGIAFDELSCWDCHDVHQLVSKKQAAGK